MLQYDNRLGERRKSPLKLRRVCLDPPWRSAQLNFYSTGKKREEQKPKGKEEKKITRGEGRKMHIVCYVWKLIRHACMRVVGFTHQRTDCCRSMEGRKGGPLQHGARFDKFNGLLRTRGDTTREWLRMTHESSGELGLDLHILSVFVLRTQVED